MTSRVNNGARAACVGPAVALLLVTLWPAGAAAGLRLVPDSISIGGFYAGTRVRVTGEIPRGRDAVIEVVGSRIEEQLLRKGRHWDIWMTVGEIDIEDAPSVYFALSTDPASLSAGDADSRFGYGSIRKRASFVGDVRGLSRPAIFERFIKLKEDEQLYRLLPGALRVSPLSGDRARVEGSFRVPSRIRPGDYQVRLSVLEHGRTVHVETGQLRVQMVGLPLFLTSLARQHGALHGLFAVLIAVIFGFLVGVVFKRTGRRHHDG